MGDSRLTIGEAAEASGVTTKAIRVYERRGLLEPAERTPAGYRTYGPDELALLRFIRRAKAVGLRLEDIRQVIDLQRQGTQPCADVIDLLDHRLADIDRTMKDLKALRRTLIQARDGAEQAALSGKKAVICRVIETATA